MTDKLHGSLKSLSQRIIGDQLDAAASMGIVVLSLEDVSDFDEDGGSCVINGTVYPYTSVDMDADTITLGTPLAANAAVGDRVDLWDADAEVVVSEYVAMVTESGQDDGDAIMATIDHSLTLLLGETTLAAGQSVSLSRDGEEWVVDKVHGKNNQALNRTLTGYQQYGVDNYDGSVTGLEIDTSATPYQVRLIAQSPGGGVRVQAKDRSTYLAIAASAFNVGSDPALKTPLEAAPDALAIIEAAPAYSWRYLTDEDDVQRVGPVTTDMPVWAVQVDPSDGAQSLDLGRQTGLLWAAFHQQIALNKVQAAQIAELSERVAELETGA